MTKLIFTISLLSLAIVTFMGCQPDITDLITAIEGRNFEEAQNLIDRGVPVNDESLTVQPLEQAVRSSNLEIFQSLLNSGASTQHMFANGQTPIQNLLERKYFRYLPALLDAGANFDVIWNNEPLAFFLIEMRQEEIVIEMIKQGYDANILDSFGRNLLHQEIGMATTNPEFVSFLVDSGIDPLSSQNFRVSAFEAALSSGDKPAIYAIVNSGIEVQEAERLWSPLIRVWTEKRMVEIAETFLSLGVPINRPNDFPLHSAVRQVSFEALKWFLENGADPNRLDQNGVLPEYYTWNYGGMTPVDEVDDYWVSLINQFKSEISKYR
jgi:ankyrin repeat protein